MGKRKKQPNSSAEETHNQAVAETAQQELAAELAQEQADLKALDAELRQLAAELAACEAALKAEEVCDRTLTAAGNKGPLAGGNEVYIYGDFADDPIVQIGAVDDAYFYAISASGKVWQWGFSGEDIDSLGRGEGTPYPTRILVPEPIVSVSEPVTEQSQTLMLSRSGNVYSLGDGYDGILLNGENVWVVMPTNVMGYLTPLLAGDPVIGAYAGTAGSFVVTATGKLYFAGDAHICSLSPSATPQNITGLLPLGSGEKVTQMYTGLNNAYVLTDAHRVIVWGDNDCGQLGMGTAESQICEPTDLATHFHLPAGEYIVDISTFLYSAALLTNQGNLYYVGCHEYTMMDFGDDQVEEPTLISTGVVAVSNTANILLVVRDGGRSLWIMGDNSQHYEGNGGGMGDGTNTPKRYLHEITSYFHLAEGEIFTQVASNSWDYDNSTAAILTNRGRVFTFGNGAYGQLGDGGYGESTGYAHHSNLPIDITARFVSTGASVSGVFFGDRAATAFEVIGEHLIRAIVPPGAELGNVNVTIEGPAPQVISEGYEYINEICVR
jgi:alpha-tubulin suppressor-like RCC1 family protein